MFGLALESWVTLFVIVAFITITVLWLRNMDVQSFIMTSGEIYTVREEELAIIFRRRLMFTHYFSVAHYRRRHGDTLFITHFKVPDSFECCNEALKHRLFKRAARRAGINMTEITYYKRII